MLSSEEVVSARFGRGRRGRSYDEVEVDDFLDRLIVALRGYEANSPAEVSLTSQELSDASFTAARGFGRSGYDSASVDALLTKARETLRVYESRQVTVDGGDLGLEHEVEPDSLAEAPSSRQPHVEPSTPPRSAISEPHKSVFGRLLGR